MEVVNTGFVSHIYPYFSANGQKLYCVAGSTIKSYVILEVDMDTKKVVIIKDVTKSFQLDEGYISIPKAITFPTEDNKVSHGYLYLPKVIVKASVNMDRLISLLLFILKQLFCSIYQIIYVEQRLCSTYRISATTFSQSSWRTYIFYITSL